jgi:predicted nucleotidyltransferase
VARRKKNRVKAPSYNARKQPISLIDHFNKSGYNKLEQVHMLRGALDNCKKFGGLYEAYLRGSLARGNADQLSDVDLFVVVDPNNLPEFSEAFDDYIRRKYKPFIPRCYDEHVTDYGGLGFMYLLEGDDGEIYQFDIYFAVKGRTTGNKLQDFVQKIYSKDPNYCWHTSSFDPRGGANGFKMPNKTAEYINKFKELPKCEENFPKIAKQLFVEMCVHNYLLKKHASRDDLFRASVDRYFIEKTFIELLRQKYDPYFLDTGHQGVQGFQAALASMGNVEKKLSEQIDFVINMDRDLKSASKVMTFCTDFMKREYPEVYQELQPRLGSYMDKAFGVKKFLVHENDNKQGKAQNKKKPTGNSPS